MKQCIKPVDSTEFYESTVFDATIFEMMKQDGFLITTSADKLVNVIQAEYLSVGNYHIYKKCIKDLAWLDGFHDTSPATLKHPPIYRRLLPPPLETVNHTFIIQSIIKEVNYQNATYIEYGVRTGENLTQISFCVEKAIGVDIEDPAILAANSTFYKTHTDLFSSLMLPTLRYQFAFIDADHKFESAFKDFENLYKYILPGGYIFLHDTYPCDPVLLAPQYCNDCYKTPLEIKKKYPHVEILTLPLNPGLTIVRKP